MKVKESVFYCDERMCPKTAWSTPELMTEDDWRFLSEFVQLLKAGDARGAFNLLWNTEQESVRDFFDRVIGWTEGYAYCRSSPYWLNTAFPGLVKHKLTKMEQALVGRIQ